MEEALVGLLLADSGVSALAGARVNWNERPQAGGYPCVVLTRISGGRDYTMAGPSGLVESRVQVDCYSDVSYLAAKTLWRAVRAAVSGYRGQPVTGQPELRGVFITSERDMIESMQSEKLHRISSDLTIWHEETAP